MIDEAQLIFFTLVLMRMSGCVLFNPILGRKNVPTYIKAGIIMVLTLIVFSYTPPVVVDASLPIVYGVMLFKEFAIGIILAFIISLIFYVIIFAGEFMDLQMGLSMAKIFDAQSNASLSLSATIFNATFILLFFAANGHLAMIRTLITSGQVVPYGSVVIHSDISLVILRLFCECTELAIKFSFPIFAIEFLVEIAVGILMKTIPQINVFVVNIQLKVFIGFIIILVLFSPMAEFLEDLMFMMIDAIKNSLIYFR